MTKASPREKAGERNYEAAVAPSAKCLFPIWGLGAKVAAGEECGERVKHNKWNFV